MPVGSDTRPCAPCRAVVSQSITPRHGVECPSAPWFRVSGRSWFERFSWRSPELTAQKQKPPAMLTRELPWVSTTAPGSPRSVAQNVLGDVLDTVPGLLDVGLCLLYTSDAADEEDSVDLGG